MTESTTVTPEQAILQRFGIQACLDCRRAVHDHPQPACGYLAKCGRWVALI